jgi:hypothetical protein
MKTLRLLPLLALFLLPSCNLDPGYSSYSNVLIPIDERTVPETGEVGVDVTIHASASLDNGCWSNIHFVFTQKDDLEYEMVALADFATNGVCPTVIVAGDTTVTFTPERPGNHVITFWMTQMDAERDTVVVGEAAPEK